ncbi:hypothetical protein SDC9_170740 [bioreactor metagenome]|uniref:Uncharacterized protein n=1 Tax=bioreactor metagenome TaxID=1076179 RepID=A0A645GBI8_9ZZZZ
MTRFLGDVATLEELALGHARVIHILVFLIGHIAPPAHKVVDGRLGSVTVIDLQSQTLSCQFLLNSCQRFGGHAAEPANPGFIASHGAAHEVVLGDIAHVLLDAGRQRRQRHQIGSRRDRWFGIRRHDGLHVRCATSYQKQNDRQACCLTRSHHFF